MACVSLHEPEGAKEHMRIKQQAARALESPIEAALQLALLTMLDAFKQPRLFHVAVDLPVRTPMISSQ